MVSATNPTLQPVLAQAAEQPYNFSSAPRAPPRGAEPRRNLIITPADSRAARGLYDPTSERDACGVAFVARLGAPASHEVISRALWALEHLEHRGAEGADPDTGDGAGILVQLPDELLRRDAGLELPELGRYGVAVCFLPVDESECTRAERLLERTVAEEGQRVLGWRDVPVV